MDIYDKVDSLIKEHRVSRRKLAQAVHLPPSTFQSMMSRKSGMTTDIITLIAQYFSLPVQRLINEIDFDTEIEEKLSHIGYSIGFDEENAYLWINYPDGTLEVNEAQLLKLNNDINDYIKYRLEDLKKQNFKDFRKQK